MLVVIIISKLILISVYSLKYRIMIILLIFRFILYFNINNLSTNVIHVYVTCTCIGAVTNIIQWNMCIMVTLALEQTKMAVIQRCMALLYSQVPVHLVQW